MNVLLYTDQYTESGERLTHSIKALDNLETLTNCGSMGDLLRHFQTPEPLPETVVLQATRTQDLQRLAPFRFRLEQVFFILILPDAEAETIACGHQLRPRFIAYQDSDFSEIEAVLKRLQSRCATLGTTASLPPQD
jgi:hypothetical protein